MDNNNFEMIDGNEILNALVDAAVSEEAKERLKQLKMNTDPYLIEMRLNETTEARCILDGAGSVPLHRLNGVGDLLKRIEIGEVLVPLAFEKLSHFIDECSKLNRFMQPWLESAPKVASYGMSISPLETLKSELFVCIENGRVTDQASQTLSKIRRRLEDTEDRIKAKMQSYLTDTQLGQMLSEPLISKRGGRYVIPIKSEHKRKIGGAVLDRSRSGGTVFVEPAAVKKLQDAMDQLYIDEENEVYRILSELTNETALHLEALKVNFEAMITCDVVFAKAKLSRKYRARAAAINTTGKLHLNKVRHPLLGDLAVPMSLTLTDEQRSLVITGPNTGGKTVSMKTVALSVWMTQAGLHIPCEKGTSLPIFYDILCDIGDGQSMQQNLSTFSAHVTNLKAVVAQAHEKSLIVLDEVGAGTDPSEGMALGIAVLEALHEKHAYILASTHYNEIKAFAAGHSGFLTGGMAFDLKTLKPLYRLEVGKSGNSNALLIAYRLGLPETIVSRAHKIAYQADFDASVYAAAFESPNHFGKTEKVEIEVATEPIQEKIINRSEKYMPRAASKFAIGDAVHIHTMNRSGIVCELENSKGEIGVMVMNKKIKVNQKRLSLYIEAAELYPEDYDMDIVFESKTYRKKKKQVAKGKKDVFIE